jgi:AraC-like DNA-binding protein
MTRLALGKSWTADWMSLINPQVHDVWLGNWKPGTIEPVRRLIDHELVIFAQGTCEVQLGQQRMTCPPGTFIIVPPGMEHSTRAGAESVLRYCAHFDWTMSRRPPTTRLWSFSPDWYDCRRARPAPAFIPKRILGGAFEEGAKIESLMKELFHRWRTGGPLEKASCRPLLLEVLLRLFTQAAPKPVAAASDDVAVRVRELLDSLPYRDVDRSIVNTLESLGYSYAYLCRRFTRRYGISPLQYVLHARMERAKTLLQDGGLKVLAVAAELGYQDVGYFIRTFRKYTGSTPRRFSQRAG